MYKFIKHSVQIYIICIYNYTLVGMATPQRMAFLEESENRKEGEAMKFNLRSEERREEQM